MRSTIDWKNDRRDNELVLVDVRGANARVLTHDRIGVGDPHWSPDGTALAYLASPERDKPGQLYVLPMNGGDSLKVTDASNGVSGFTWRPDSKAIAYVTANDAPNKKEIEKHLDSVVITDNDYLTRSAPQPSHIWVVNADGSSNTRLTDGAFSVVGEPSWSPDATKLYYTHAPDALFFAHLNNDATYVHNIAAKTDTPVVAETSQSATLSL